MLKVLMTGASGLIGSTALKELDDLYFLTATDKLSNAEKNISQLDFTNFDSLVEFKSDFGAFDAIVHIGALNSAVENPSKDNIRDIFSQDIEDWRKYFETNVLGSLNLVKVFLPDMLTKRSGKFIFFGSTYGVVAPPKELYMKGNEVTFFKDPAYGVSKAGVLNLCKYLASFYGCSGVTFNCISPGGIENGQALDFLERYSSIVPAGRMGRAEEIVPAIKFLLDEKNTYTNGTNIVVDGGWLSR